MEHDRCAKLDEAVSKSGGENGKQVVTFIMDVVTVRSCLSDCLCAEMCSVSIFGRHKPSNIPRLLSGYVSFAATCHCQHSILLVSPCHKVLTPFWQIGTGEYRVMSLVWSIKASTPQGHGGHGVGQEPLGRTG